MGGFARHSSLSLTFQAEEMEQECRSGTYGAAFRKGGPEPEHRGFFVVDRSRPERRCE